MDMGAELGRERRASTAGTDDNPTSANHNGRVTVRAWKPGSNGCGVAMNVTSWERTRRTSGAEQGPTVASRRERACDIAASGNARPLLRHGAEQG